MFDFVHLWFDAKFDKDLHAILQTFIGSDAVKGGLSKIFC